jgi:hypothetical protein
VHKGFSIAGKVPYSANMFLKIKTVCLHDVIPEMQGFSRVSEVFRKNKKGGVIIPDDNIT